MQDYKKKLDAVSSAILKAYFDSVMFLTVVPIVNDKRKTSNFLFDYSYYSIRERAIISTKSVIEPSGKDKLTIEKILKKLQQNEQYKQFSDELYARYKELFISDKAKRIKEFRDSLCHNIENASEKMLYCRDIMDVIAEIMDILDCIYQHLFNTTNKDFDKIQYISKTLANDYWTAICDQADKMPKRIQELTELQRMLDCEK